MNKIYLDYASTTPLSKEIYSSYNKLLLEAFANADSNHFLGNKAKNYLKSARNRIAQLLGVQEKEVIFTSGSTEANNMAIKGVCFAYSSRGKHIITSKVEHSSVLETFKQLEDFFNFEVTYLDVDNYGRVDPKLLKSYLRNDTILVSIMAVNNEIGSINNIYEISNIIKSNSTAFFHVDATQSMGKENIDFSKVDLYNFSAHKIYGLKGSGILVKKENVRILPLINGGEQEEGLRGGTSNWQTYTIMAKTLRIALSNQISNHLIVEELNAYTREKLSVIKGIVFNSSQYSTPYILNFYIPNKKGEVLLNALSNKKICISSRSACSSYNNEMSIPVYELTKNEEMAKNSLRVSFAHFTTKEEIDYFTESFLTIIGEVK